MFFCEILSQMRILCGEWCIIKPEMPERLCIMKRTGDKIIKDAPLYEVREIKDLRDMFRQSCELYKNKDLFYIKETHKQPYKGITFEQYYRDVNALGTMLMEKGLKDKAVAIVAKTRYEWYVSYMAVVIGLGIIVPLDKELPANEMLNCIERAHVSAVIYEDSKKDDLFSFKDTLKDVMWIGMDQEEDVPSEDIYSFSRMLDEGRGIFDDAAAGAENAYKEYYDLEIDRDAMSILLFTSGTTSDAKAVMLSHRNICKNLMAMCSMVYIGQEDVFFSVLPLHHTYECTCGFLCEVYRGSSIAICEGLRYITSNMQEAKPTIILSVPLLLENFHKKIFSKQNAGKLRALIKVSNALLKVGIDVRNVLFKKVYDAFGGRLRMMIVGGAKIDPKIIRDIRGLGIMCLQGYGLTECAPILALNRDVNYRDDSAGLALPDVDIRVIDKDEDGIGEIIGKGDNVMLGYYGAEDLTKESIVDGYYHTGDLGYLTDDGFVIITGRKKNVIVTQNGKNIFPEELEFLLNKSDYIEESVVYGRKLESGEVLIEVEVFPNKENIKADLGKDDEATVSQAVGAVVKDVNSQTVSYKCIKDFKLRDTEFEKTTSKKIKRKIQEA